MTKGCPSMGASIVSAPHSCHKECSILQLSQGMQRFSIAGGEGYEMGQQPTTDMDSTNVQFISLQTYAYTYVHSRIHIHITYTYAYVHRHLHLHVQSHVQIHIHMCQASRKVSAACWQSVACHHEQMLRNILHESMSACGTLSCRWHL